MNLLKADKLFLVGMPGSGKSTLGKKLANQLSYDFIDLDTEIEQKAGEEIARIFEHKGEAYFRELESATLKKLSLRSFNQGVVISTGGGTPCYFDNMNMMNNEGITIYLDTQQSELLKRLQDSNLAKRPKFGDEKELAINISKLYKKRRAFYEKAQFQISSDTITPDQVLELLSK